MKLLSLREIRSTNNIKSWYSKLVKEVCNQQVSFKNAVAVCNTSGFFQ